MDEVELVELSRKIVSLSTELSQARAARDEAQTKVLALEAELMPLLAKNAQLISGIVGTVSAAAGASAMGPAGLPVENSPAGPSTEPSNGALKARVVEFLKRRNSEDPIYASDIADILKIDSSIVRDVLREMRDAS